MRIWLLAQDEVIRFLSTRRGLFALLGFSLIWLALLYYAILPAAAVFADPSNSVLVRLLLSGFSPSDLEGGLNWPAAELAVYWGVSLYLFPFLALLTSADQTASDRNQGTLRFLVMRCSRLDIFWGRFIGQCIVMLAVILFTLGSVLLVIAFTSPEKLGLSLAKSPMIIINLWLVLMPYIALMSLVSVLAKSARQATLLAVILWISALLVVGLIRSRFGDFPILNWVLPGSQVSELIKLSDWSTMSYAFIPLVHATIFLLVGSLFMRGRDL